MHPQVVDEKSRLGDWELDTVIGKGRRGAMGTMAERKSKLLKIKKVGQKTGKLVGQAICQKLTGFQVLTLTSDNGQEFSDHHKNEVVKLKVLAHFWCKLFPFLFTIFMRKP